VLQLIVNRSSRIARSNVVRHERLKSIRENRVCRITRNASLHSQCTQHVIVLLFILFTTDVTYDLDLNSTVKSESFLAARLYFF